MLPADTVETRITERVMRRVKDKIPDLDTASYNRVWESIHGELCDFETHSIVIVPDNDWAVVAKYSKLPMRVKRAIPGHDG